MRSANHMCAKRPNSGLLEFRPIPSRSRLDFPPSSFVYQWVNKSPAPLLQKEGRMQTRLTRSQFEVKDTDRFNAFFRVVLRAIEFATNRVRHHHAFIVGQQ